MHLAPGYKEFLRSLIASGGGLLAVHQAAWRRAFPDEPIPPTMPYFLNGGLGAEVEDAAPSSEAEELSGDSSSDDGGPSGDVSSEEEGNRLLQRRRLL